MELVNLVFEPRLLCGLYCSLSVRDHEPELNSDDITMATATHVDSMDTVNNCHQSVVGGRCEDDIESCLRRLIALGDE